MKLFLVWGNTVLIDDFGSEYDLKSLYGIFSSSEKADQVVKSLREKSAVNDSEDYYTDEWELDELTPILEIL